MLLGGFLVGQVLEHLHEVLVFAESWCGGDKSHVVGDQLTVLRADDSLDSISLTFKISGAVLITLVNSHGRDSQMGGHHHLSVLLVVDESGVSGTIDLLLVVFVEFLNEGTHDWLVLDPGLLKLVMVSLELPVKVVADSVKSTLDVLDRCLDLLELSDHVLGSFALDFVD